MGNNLSWFKRCGLVFALSSAIGCSQGRGPADLASDVGVSDGGVFDGTVVGADAGGSDDCAIGCDATTAPSGPRIVECACPVNRYGTQTCDGAGNCESCVCPAESVFDSEASVHRACAWLTACGLFASMHTCVLGAYRQLANGFATAPRFESRFLRRAFEEAGTVGSCDELHQRLDTSADGPCNTPLGLCDGNRAQFCSALDFRVTRIRVDCGTFGSTCVDYDDTSGFEYAICADEMPAELPPVCAGNTARSVGGRIYGELDCGDDQCVESSPFGDSFCVRRLPDCDEPGVVCEGNNTAVICASIADMVAPLQPIDSTYGGLPSLRRNVRYRVDCTARGAQCVAGTYGGCVPEEMESVPEGCEGNVARFAQPSIEAVGGSGRRVRFDCASVGLVCAEGLVRCQLPTEEQ